MGEITVVHHGEPGAWWAEVVELSGCFAAGATLGELRESLREAVRLYLADA